MAEANAGDVGTRDPVRIGLVSVSDRASAGVYEDKGIPALRDWLSRAILNPVDWETRLIADEQPSSARPARARRRRALRLLLTTGGTGPRPRDVTPRRRSRSRPRRCPASASRCGASVWRCADSILSRQVAVVRGRGAVINLPGQPKAIAETLGGLPGATPPVPEFLRRCPTAST